ncbi:MAG TPA: hypothetical protein VNS50_07505 [Ginsengibacter sp.]|nr:hypothetical protein [Ginsengibacter sp.]
MKHLNQISKVTGLLLMSAVVFFSCKKDNTTSQSADTPEVTAAIDATQSVAVAEAQYDDVFNITMGVQTSDIGENIGIGAGVGIIYSNVTNPDGTPTSTPDSATSRCFTVTVVPHIAHQFPKTVTIDFGTEGCLGKDGKLRKGKIVTIYTGPMAIPGSTTSTTFVDYFVDSFKIEGTHTVENTSLSNKAQWTVKVIDGKITNINNGNWRKWSSFKVHTQVDGNGTPLYPLDDKFEITGHSSGSNSNGNSWTAEIVNPLIKKFTCPWRVKGTVNITRNNTTAVLDYGDGTCDDKATVTINGVTHIITLHK